MKEQAVKTPYKIKSVDKYYEVRLENKEKQLEQKTHENHVNYLSRERLKLLQLVSDTRERERKELSMKKQKKERKKRLIKSTSLNFNELLMQQFEVFQTRKTTKLSQLLRKRKFQEEKRFQTNIERNRLKSIKMYGKKVSNDGYEKRKQKCKEGRDKFTTSLLQRQNDRKNSRTRLKEKRMNHIENEKKSISMAELRTMELRAEGEKLIQEMDVITKELQSVYC